MGCTIRIEVVISRQPFDRPAAIRPSAFVRRPYQSLGLSGLSRRLPAYARLYPVFQYGLS